MSGATPLLPQYSFMAWAGTSPIIIIFVTMQGIYNYIPETNRVSRVHGVAAVVFANRATCLLLLLLL